MLSWFTVDWYMISVCLKHCHWLLKFIARWKESLEKLLTCCFSKIVKRQKHMGSFEDCYGNSKVNSFRLSLYKLPGIFKLEKNSGETMCFFIKKKASDKVAHDLLQYVIQHLISNFLLMPLLFLYPLSQRPDSRDASLCLVIKTLFKVLLSKI